MSDKITVAAEPRASRGKNEARRLRVQGQIPGIVYGARKDAIAVAVDPRQLQKILHSKSGHNTIFDVTINGEAGPAMVVDWQYDPIKDTLLHVDLKRIDLLQRLQVQIPVMTQGEPKGVKVQGGLLEVVTREVSIECLPDEIPENFTIDVSELMLGQSIRAGDIALSGSMQLLTTPESVLAHVVSVRATEEPTAAATTETAATPAGSEPEVIKKGKKEEEAEAAAEKEKKKK
ncbi:MAG TPA: 50S ribosomal protein L25 [Bryobacteraceae bacterium]|nr:50S ribosomal protein L25 [Bryobacteraceae bacterium]